MRKKKRNEINAKFAEYMQAYNDLLTLNSTYVGDQAHWSAIQEQSRKVSQIRQMLRAMCDTNESIIHLQELMENTNIKFDM